MQILYIDVPLKAEKIVLYILIIKNIICDYVLTKQLNLIIIIIERENKISTFKLFGHY